MISLLNFVLVAIPYRLSRITGSSPGPLLLLRTHRLGRQILDFEHKFKESFALFPACRTEHRSMRLLICKDDVWLDLLQTAVTVDATGLTCRGQQRARFHLYSLLLKIGSGQPCT